MDINQFIENLNNILFKNQLVDSIIIIIISYIIYAAINKLVFNNKRKSFLKLTIGGKNDTYLHMIKNTVKYIIIIITVLIILQINGINVTSLLAGIGILSVVIGLALQDALKDIIKGINILSDNYFKVGDVIKYKGIEGKVLIVGLKTTKIKDITNQNVVAIANRNIEQVEVVSNQLDIELPIPYEVSKEKAEIALKQITETIKQNIQVESCNYIGINKLDDSALLYLVRIQCDPATKYQTKRDCHVIMMDLLNKNNIEVPYKQIDIHNK